MTTIKEKNYTELNTGLEQLNVKAEELTRQLEELSAKRNEIETEIKVRREQVIQTQIRLTNQLMENTRLMIEMGIDPESIAMEGVYTCEDSIIETTASIGENNEIENSSPDDNAIEEETTDLSKEQETESITGGDDTCLTPESIEGDNDLSSDDEEEYEEESEESTSKSKKKKAPRLLKPYYYVWGLRKGSMPKTCDVPKWKNNAPRLQFSFERYVKDGCINRSMNLGNLNYRETYPNPDESRIYSVNGIAPTLTRMHSNLDVWIGDNPRKTEEQLRKDAA